MSDLSVPIDTAVIVREILRDYALNPRGLHGVLHWARVLENGLRIAASTGANAEVVTLFALFHDSRRVNDNDDPGHGLRGAELARSLRGSHIHLWKAEFDLLFEACRLHTEGALSADVTIQACWDADRLDLGRVGTTPDPARLGSDAARELIVWATERAEADYESPMVRSGWL